MSNEIQVINEQEVLGKQFKMYGTFEEPLFLAKDVANWIDYSGRTGQLLNTVDEDEKLMHILYASGQNREMWFLTEYGLYEVLMQSRKPIAKQFKKQVKAILKGLRKGEMHLSISEEEMAIVNIVNAEDGIQMANAIRSYKKLITQPLTDMIEEQKPKVDFADTVSNTEKLVDMKQYAKLISKEDGIDLGRNELLKLLRDSKYLMVNNEPYQRYIKQGIFEVIETTIPIGDIVLQTMITGKGQIYLLKKIKKILDKE